jgi:nitrate reductase NapE
VRNAWQGSQGEQVQNILSRMDSSPATPDRLERRREWTVFLLLAFGLAPVFAVLTVASYGFAVWAYQMIVGPPGPPPP